MSEKDNKAIHQFDFSESHIKWTNRLFFFLLPVLMLGMLLISLLISDFDIQESITIWLLTCLMFGTIHAIQMPLSNRRLRRMKVFIYEDKIVKQCGKRGEIVFWKDIAKIKLVYFSNGDLRSIYLYLKNKKATIFGGFNNIEKIAEIIKEKISDNTLIQTKHSRLNPQNPTLPMISLLATMIIFCVIISWGEKAVNIFIILFVLSTGLLMWIYRPLSKSDLSLRRFELFSVVFFIVMGIFFLIFFLLNGEGVIRW